jgi:hypothetical protein
MGPEGFRKLALSLPGAEEKEHMDHPDFRVGGKIFATLGYPGEAWAMVKLTPAQQGNFAREEPGMFESVGGTWGARGATLVRLKTARKQLVRKALAAAWGNLAKSVTDKLTRKGGTVKSGQVRRKVKPINGYCKRALQLT